MELISVRGGKIEDVQNKRYTIGVGISLGNKWFTVDNILSLIEWSLEYSKDKVIVYVADSIHAINIEVRDNIIYDKALKKANRLGDDILTKVKEKARLKLSPEDNLRIMYLKWNEIVDGDYLKKLDYLKTLYKHDDFFRESILSLVKSFIAKEKRVFSSDQLGRLGEYILAELPEVINRVKMNGIVCDAYAYPFNGELAEFVEKIQKGEKFPQIKNNIMDTEPKVFIEVR